MLFNLFVNWTAVLTAVQVLQHKFLDAFPVNQTHTHNVTRLPHHHRLLTHLVWRLGHLGIKAPLVSEGSSSSRPSNNCDLDAFDEVSAFGRTRVAGRGVSL